MSNGKSSGAAQNELGQLFVDIGVNGVGKTLKSLNSVAATFLLGKNAANQFAQTLTQPFKEAGNAAVQIGKMSEALATSDIEYQKLAMHLKKYNLSEGLINDISKLQKFFLKFNQGIEQVPQGWVLGLDKAQLDLQRGQYAGTYEGATKFIDDLRKQLANKSKEERNLILDQFGLNNEWGYAFSKPDFNLGDYYTIPDSAIKANQSLQESMNDLKQTMDNLWQELLAEIAPSLKTIADTLTEWLKNWGKNGGVQKTVDAVQNVVDNRPKTVKDKVIYSMPITVIPKMIKDAVDGYKGNGTTTGGAASIFPENTKGVEGILPDVGNGVPSGVTQNITNNISHDITINGGNADEIAQKIAGISEEDIQYSQYQSANMTGI